MKLSLTIQVLIDTNVRIQIIEINVTVAATHVFYANPSEHVLQSSIIHLTAPAGKSKVAWGVTTCGQFAPLAI